jgi:predicted metalloprotease
MRWEDKEGSSNIEDVRGRGGGGGRGFPRMGGGFPVRGRLGGIGLIVVLGIAFLIGGPQLAMQLLGMTGGMGAPQQAAVENAEPAATPGEDTRFVSAVLQITEESWAQQFRSGGMAAFGVPAGSVYEPPRMVVFREAVQTACGVGQSAMGPFYCPGDSKVYIDLAFFDELSRRFGAPGDFAQAYVVAHEVGHHVQNIIGVMDRTAQMRGRLNERQMNEWQVRVELQADCFAGVWANFVQRDGRLETGDMDEALKAAFAVGDDTLQKATQGYVVPDSFTHGTSEQRMSWFRRGFDSGQPAQCDTFSARAL